VAKGTLIGESVRVGATLEGVALHVEKIFRVAVGDEPAGQPKLWTFIEFEVPDDDAPALADALSQVLEVELGWYCDFRTEAETFVVFSGRVFRYPRGDRAARAEVEGFARSRGVPDSQLDWPEE
jgi:hypothetical protein